MGYNLIQNTPTMGFVVIVRYNTNDHNYGHAYRSTYACLVGSLSLVNRQVFMTVVFIRTEQTIG